MKGLWRGRSSGDIKERSRTAHRAGIFCWRARPIFWVHFVDEVKMIQFYLKKNAHIFLWMACWGDVRALTLKKVKNCLSRRNLLSESSSNFLSTFRRWSQDDSILFEKKCTYLSMNGLLRRRSSGDNKKGRELLIAPKSLVGELVKFSLHIL